MLLQINPDNPQPRLIKQVVEALRQGAVICYPTDTVYGIGCDIFNQKAVKRIYQLKQRPLARPFSFICADLKDVSTYAHVSNTGYRVLRKSLPGPYTFVLPATKLVPKIMMTKQKTVGIRMPDHRICMELVTGLGNPILTTSAAPDDPDARQLIHAYEVEERYGKQVDLIIDSGPLAHSSPSTVVSLEDDDLQVLRPGKGSLEGLG
ncbi:L-threonylcarbamoyladenylate synthase [Desulfurivibrio alkaliphilus]|uniref:Sua5/YciO/YrdC/YwlC family protein n=1 Tax=Desulfurivibrio alkaliphilus (strain DSM 19089 / UNIQEM U267 / AHT2) TaxID=589865 RepID=D6Z3W2_DESAT|nr:L-threonylcarbamoyladenylate synthase [Desulfurivibrio alkaliphilus]ADH86237.1 Sua5/YciO/YrdC/YwlC family protein [Desulfurivibrio alkaliphilus AHT 2]